MSVNPSPSSRGFAVFEPIAGAYGGHVWLYESSAATAPRIWLEAVNSSNPSEAANPGAEATIHLDLAAAELLRDQLTWLIGNHYQVNPARSL